MADTANKRLLLVDDEEDLVWSITSRLAKAMPELVVDGTSQPELASRWLGERRYDLVISDIRMPKVSGLELLIRARSLHPALPFIVITAFPSEQSQREAMRLGSVTYIEKPFDFDNLLAAIRNQLGRSTGGFSGALQLETLPDLVQLFTLSNSTGVLRIWEDAHEGQIWFDRGSIIAANAGEKVGRDAFYEILRWSAGRFSMERHVALPQRTIFESAAGLLIEAFRLADEEARLPEPVRAPEASRPPAAEPGADAMPSLSGVVGNLRALSGYVGFALVDTVGRSLVAIDRLDAVTDLAPAALSTVDTLDEEERVLGELGGAEAVEEFVTTTSSQYHLIRPLPGEGQLLFLVLARAAANLATARISLRQAQQQLAAFI